MRRWLIIAFWVCVPLACAQRSEDRINASAGKLVSVHDRVIEVRNDQRSQKFLVTPETEIWRGDYVDIAQLRIGDDLGVRFKTSNVGDPIAVSVEANIDRWSGIISKVTGDVVEIRTTDKDGHPTGQKAAIVFWDRTSFLVEASRSDLRAGAHLEVVGLVMARDKMKAWRVIGFDAPK